MAPNILGLRIWMFQMPLLIILFFVHWDEEILINGYARSLILLQEGKKGKYMCCLVFKQGLHKGKTCAILIILFKLENVAKKQRADVQARPLDKDTVAMLNAPNDALAGALK
jgi:hypothetical protein